MNSEQFMGIIRTMLASVGAAITTWALALGIPNEVWVAITGAAGMVVAALWSAYSNSLTSMITKVAAAPEVAKVLVTDPTIAATVPLNNVTTVNEM